MIVKLGENKTQIVNNMTINGFTVDVYLYAAATNTAFVAGSFVPSEVQVKVELKRPAKGNMTMVSDNMQLLGLFSAKDYGNNDWNLGTVLTAAAVGVFESKLHTVFIPFGGPVNLKADDQIIISFIVGRGVWSAAVDSSLSYLDFNYNECIGLEYATPRINSQVVQTNINNEKYSLGDRVTKVMFINYDKTTIAEASQVISSLTMSSDKLNYTKNFFQLYSANKNMFTPPQVKLRYVTAAAAEAFPALPLFPQAFTIFASPDQVKDNLKNCQLNLSFNTTNVNASQNYVVWISFDADADTYVKAVERAEKHKIENIESIPVTTPVGK